MSVQTKQDDAVRRVRTDTRTTEKYEGNVLDFLALLTSERRDGRAVILFRGGQAIGLEFEILRKQFLLPGESPPT